MFTFSHRRTLYCVNPGKMSNLNAAANVTRQNKTILYNLVWRGRQLSIECLCMRWRLAIFSRQKKPNWEYIVRWLRKPSSNEKWSNSAREIESWDQNRKRLNFQQPDWSKNSREIETRKIASDWITTARLVRRYKKNQSN